MTIEINLEKILFERSSNEKEGKALKVPELAEATGLSKTTLYKLTKKESTRIDTETLNILCNVLDCDVNDILVFKKDQNSNKSFNKR